MLVIILIVQPPAARWQRPPTFLTQVAVIILIVQPPAARADNWPQFRGPTGHGQAAERDLPNAWGGPNNQNVRWQAPLVGQGYASPIVWAGHVVVCTAAWPDKTADKAATIPDHHVTCLFSTWASPVADADGNIYFATAGKSFVIKAGGTFQIVATSDLLDGNHASPAVSEGAMYLVGMEKLYCVRISRQ